MGAWLLEILASTFTIRASDRIEVWPPDRFRHRRTREAPLARFVGGPALAAERVSTGPPHAESIR